MPTYEECMRIINPLGIPPEALSYTEKIFLQFCEFWDSYPEELKKVVKRW